MSSQAPRQASDEVTVGSDQHKEGFPPAQHRNGTADKNMRAGTENEHIRQLGGAAHSAEHGARRLEWVKVHIVDRLPHALDWTKPHLTNPKSLKTLFRCWLAAWLAVVFSAIGPVRNALGASYYIQYVIAFVLPPSQSFVCSVEQSLLALFLTTVSYAWACLALWLAWLARGSARLTQTEFTAQAAAQLSSQGYTVAEIPLQVEQMIYHGSYLSWRSSAVLLVFSSISAGFLLWFRAYAGPGLLNIAAILPSALISVIATLGPLFPYPFYKLTNSFFYSFMLQVAINIVASAVVFPTSVQQEYLALTASALKAVRSIAAVQEPMLATDIQSPEWHRFSKGFAKDMAAMNRSIALMAGSSKYLEHDVSPRFISGADAKRLQSKVRLIVSRTAGWMRFHDLIASHISREDTSDDQNLLLKVGHKNADSLPPGAKSAPESESHPKFRPKPWHRLTEHRMEPSPVGQYESQRYAALGERIAEVEQLPLFVELMTRLHDVSREVLAAIVASLDFSIAAIERMEAQNLAKRLRRGRLDWQQIVANDKQARAKLQETSDNYLFRDIRRVIDVFEPLFDDSTGSSPSLRAYHWMCQYVNAVRQITTSVDDLLEAIETLDSSRQHLRLWWPKFEIWQWLTSYERHGARDIEQAEDEDPEKIPGLRQTLCKARNPDFLPSSSTLNVWGDHLSRSLDRLAQNDVIFGCKGAILFALLQLPSHVRESAYFFYVNRGFWTLFSSFLSFSLFIGDTSRQLIYRIFGTLAGATLSMVIWYVGDGGGNGSPYGFCASAGFFFVGLMFFRLYFPDPALVSIVSFACVMPTAYSWFYGHDANPDHVSPGWDVAWRRFVAVSIGVGSAFVFAFVPPTAPSQKAQIRLTHAKVLEETGNLFTSVIDMAGQSMSSRAKHTDHIIDNKMALRLGLLSTQPRKALVHYEWSLRGEWPTKLYDALLQHQLYILDLCTTLLGVFNHLPRCWIRLLLMRTHLDDASLLADVMSTFASLSWALKTATPLPAVHSPLLPLAFGTDRLYSMSEAEKRYAQAQRSAPDSDGVLLPDRVNFQVLCDINHQRFAVGVSTVFALLNRMDRMSVVIKELVGERYEFHSLSSSESKESLLRMAEHNSPGEGPRDIM